MRVAIKKSGVTVKELESLKTEIETATAKGQEANPDPTEYGGSQEFIDLVAEMSSKDVPGILGKLLLGEEAKLAAKAFELITVPKVSIDSSEADQGIRASTASR
jgi:hypothetical protein